LIAVTCLFIVQEIKVKEKKRKREIESKKIDKNKRKSKSNPMIQEHHNSIPLKVLPPDELASLSLSILSNFSSTSSNIHL